MINYINIFLMINSFLNVRYLEKIFVDSLFRFKIGFSWNFFVEIISATEIKIIATYERSFPLNKDTNNNFTIACKF